MALGPDPQDLDRVALAALAYVQDGMTLGLGTGRAAEAFIKRLGEKVQQGLHVTGVATSVKSEALAKQVQIPVVSIDDVTSIDVAFDGADEVTPELALTKGLGGALLRERVVAYEAAQFIVLVTPEKLVSKLGERTAIPIEVVPFAAAAVARNLVKLGGTPTLRKRDDGATFITDNGNPILDTAFSPIADPKVFGAALRNIPGVVDHGLFVDMADVVLVGYPGEVRELR